MASKETGPSAARQRRAALLIFLGFLLLLGGTFLVSRAVRPPVALPGGPAPRTAPLAPPAPPLAQP
ncbi:MAG TPA: hypothetical protein VGM19_01970 [Armatimonadota bacterium]|jgi:hypothetical protein